jgi:membrane protein YqaA with SNARE-associated domain
LLESITDALIEFGPWGVLLLAFIDSAGIPVSAGMDALIIFLAVKAPERAYWGALLAVLGSVAGNLILFLASRKGGRRFVQEAPVPGRTARFRRWFDRYGLVTVFVPALVPLPLPLKVFVISAGMLRTRLRTFLLVILAARIPRYFGEAYLGVKLGDRSADYLRQNAWSLVGLALLLAVVLYVVIRLNDRYRRPAANLS